MFTLSSEVYGLIILLFIPLLWSIHTSLSHPHSKLVQDPVEVASEQEEEPREAAEDVDLDSDSDLTAVTGNTFNNNDNNNNKKLLLQRTQTSPDLQFSEVLVIFEQFN